MTTATATATAEVCVSFFLPTDARHWIPNGTANLRLVVDADEFASDPEETLSDAAEAWCEATHGAGSFWGIVLEP